MHKKRIQEAFLFCLVGFAGALSWILGLYLLNHQIISQRNALLIFAWLATYAGWIAVLECSARQQMECQIVEERRKLLEQTHHYVEGVLSTLLARALQCPTQYYAHRIFEALDHIEAMVHSVIGQWKLQQPRQQPESPPPEPINHLSRTEERVRLTSLN